MVSKSSARVILQLQDSQKGYFYLDHFRDKVYLTAQHLVVSAQPGGGKLWSGEWEGGNRKFLGCQLLCIIQWELASLPNIFAPNPFYRQRRGPFHKMTSWIDQGGQVRAWALLPSTFLQSGCSLYHKWYVLFHSSPHTSTRWDEVFPWLLGTNHKVASSSHCNSFFPYNI